MRLHRLHAVTYAVSVVNSNVQNGEDSDVTRGYLIVSNIIYVVRKTMTKTSLVSLSDF